MGGDWPVPRLLLAALSVAVLVALVVAASTSSAAFGLYNPAWDGTAELRELATDGDGGRVVLDTAAYEGVPAANTTAVVLAPERPYGDTDAARLRSFVREGGTLVVADDLGTAGNALLAAVGATARVDGAVVRDERAYYRSPALPVAEPVAPDPLLAGVDALVLNYGSVVAPGEASVLARTGAYAYVDRDGDGELDAAESLARHPVLTREAVGDGAVVVASDPSVFINAMLDRPGNRRFAANVLASGERVLLDYSHAGSQPPLAALVLAVRGSPAARVLAGLLAIGLAAGAGRLLARRGAGAGRGAAASGESAARPERGAAGITSVGPERGDDERA